MTPFVFVTESLKAGVGRAVAIRFVAGVWKKLEADRFCVDDGTGRLCVPLGGEVARLDGGADSVSRMCVVQPESRCALMSPFLTGLLHIGHATMMSV